MTIDTRFVWGVIHEHIVCLCPNNIEIPYLIIYNIISLHFIGALCVCCFPPLFAFIFTECLLLPLLRLVSFLLLVFSGLVAVLGKLVIFYSFLSCHLVQSRRVNIRAFAMRCCSSFLENRLNPDSFHGRIEWSLRAALSFFISALCGYYFEDYIAVPFLLPVLVLVATRSNFGETMHVIQSTYKGTTLICILSTISYFIPVLDDKYWWCTLIYFFIISMLLSVSLSHDSGARKIALAFHAIFTFQIAYNEDDSPSNVSFIWEAWLMVPMTLVLASIGVLLPVPIFAYQQLLFAEDNAVRMLRQWLHDMMEYLYHSREDKTASKIQWSKLQKYVDEGRRSRHSINAAHSVSMSHEMVHEDNLMIDSQRIESLLSLHYILVGMHDIVRQLKYDDFHYDLFDAIKQPLRLFVGELLDRMDDINGNNNGREQSPLSAERPLMATDDQLMESFESARHRLVFNKDSERENINVQSLVAIYSFLYYLQVFTRKCSKYLELHAMYMDQLNSSNCWNRFIMLCGLSISDILHPLPWSSLSQCKESISPFVHWKSPVFLQSLGISVSMTISGLFFIYPPLHSHYPLGYWASITVGSYLIHNQNVKFKGCDVRFWC